LAVGIYSFEYRCAFQFASSASVTGAVSMAGVYFSPVSSTNIYPNCGQYVGVSETVSANATNRLANYGNGILNITTASVVYYGVWLTVSPNTNITSIKTSTLTPPYFKYIKH